MAPESFSVSELLGSIDAALKVCFPDEVWVEGEISALKAVPVDASDPGRGRHIFFNLVDPETVGMPGSGRPVLPVKLFDTQRQRVNAYLRRYDAAGIKMTDGVRVRISGQLQLYAARSQIELRMNLLDPSYTLALLATERDRVLQSLLANGLLERNAALAVPPVPLRVGVVTSVGSAAAADFLHELEQSRIGWQVVVAHTRVQGAGAEASLARAIASLEARQVDVLALVRGGGARTELATFDAEVVARAIAECAIPVFTGIGHETDESVADRVSHSAFKTPTACAGALVSRVEAFLARAESNWDEIARAAVDVCRQSGNRVERSAGVVEARTRVQLAQSQGALDGLSARAVSSARRAITTRTGTLEHLDARVRSHDPVRALARGWTITRTEDGHTVRGARLLGAGARIVTTFHDGDLTSVVDQRHPEEHP